MSEPAKRRWALLPSGIHRRTSAAVGTEGEAAGPPQAGEREGEGGSGSNEPERRSAWEDIDWGVRIHAITHTGDGGGRQSLLPVTTASHYCQSLLPVTTASLLLPLPPLDPSEHPSHPAAHLPISRIATACLPLPLLQLLPTRLTLLCPAT